jgi:A/G-specific adenine glycosylase
VKRVLARACAIEGYPGQKRVADALWESAERLLPERDLEAYTQGLMDLGAIVCVRANPRCGVCPVSAHCGAFETGRVADFPAPRPRRVLPHKRCGMMIIEHEGNLLLEKRPAVGVWGGLWCFPEVDPGSDLEALCVRRYGIHVRSVEPMHAVEHGFTHFTLTISPMRMRVARIAPQACESDCRWIGIDDVKASAVPAPVRRIVDAIAGSER